MYKYETIVYVYNFNYEGNARCAWEAKNGFVTIYLKKGKLCIDGHDSIENLRVFRWCRFVVCTVSAVATLLIVKSAEDFFDVDHDIEDDWDENDNNDDEDIVDHDDDDDDDDNDDDDNDWICDLTDDCEPDSDDIDDEDEYVDDDDDDVDDDGVGNLYEQFKYSIKAIRSDCVSAGIRTVFVWTVLFAGIHSSDMLETSKGNREKNIIGRPYCAELVKCSKCPQKLSYISLGLHFINTSTVPLAVTRRPIERPLKVIAPFGPFVRVTVCIKRCCNSSITPLSK